MRRPQRDPEQLNEQPQQSVKPATPPPSVLSGAGNQAIAQMAANQPNQLARFMGIGDAVHTAGAVVGEIAHGVAGDALEGSVGAKGDNHPGDVMMVERMLAAAGITDSDIGKAIERFQRDVLGWGKPDGRVDPGGKTFKALQSHSAAKPAGGGGGGGAAAGAGGGTHADPHSQPASTPAKPKPQDKPEQPAPFGAASGVENWPAVLPTATRDPKKKQQITYTAGQDQVNTPAIDVPEFTDDQKKVFEEIKANREALPEFAALKEATYKKKWKGMAMGESGAAENLEPTELQGGGSDRATQVKKVAYDELKHEGTVDSINTYDNQILTWGKGFSAHSGSMNEVLMKMFELDPEAKHVLLRAGIDCDRHHWKLVNQDTGMIETDDNALRLMQFDPKLLGVFVSLGRGAHQQAALDAQWDAMQKHAAKVPQYAYGWGDDAIALCVHLAHWSPAFGWGSNPRDYEATHGDPFQIAKTWGLEAQTNGAYTTKLKNGAVIGPDDIMQPGHRLLSFGKSVGGHAVQSQAAKVSGTRKELEENADLANHLLYPVWGSKTNEYYDLGALK